jgi:hypothetical protein
LLIGAGKNVYFDLENQQANTVVWTKRQSALGVAGEELREFKKLAAAPTLLEFGWGVFSSSVGFIRSSI